MENEHFQSLAATGPRVFQHLSVTGGVAEGGMRALADHEVNTLGLTGIVVVKEELRVFDQERLAVLLIAIGGAAGRAHHLLGRDAIHPLGIDADEILPPSGDI